MTLCHSRRQTDRQTLRQTDRQTESSCVNIVLESCQFVYVHLLSLYIHSQTVSESVSLEYSPVQCLNNDILYVSHDQCWVWCQVTVRSVTSARGMVCVCCVTCQCRTFIVRCRPVLAISTFVYKQLMCVCLPALCSPKPHVTVKTLPCVPGRLPWHAHHSGFGLLNFYFWIFFTVFITLSLCTWVWVRLTDR